MAMNEKTADTAAAEVYNEGDELRVVVTELNQNVAYLSKMVMQLQRSLNSKKQTEQTPSASSNQPTLH
jgi:uncharacterized small protein (DUF1192 family)